ncbi:MAG: hypothetical protein JRI23_03760 [Deltaproteobacteria bacterium]|jgi:hypothetical protein|nr:hypothetical protein [Deltaproteobacteria bacterium]MBW2530635.1 hypothetical protein [Deltaproteobacteria bacterium]
MKRLALVALVVAPLACTFTTTRPEPTVGAASSTAEPGGSPSAAATTVPDATVAPPDATAAPTAPTADPAKPPPCSDGKPKLDPHAEIKLLEPGSEPRQKLRYQPRVGTQKTLAYELSTSMEVKQNGKVAQQAKVGFTLYIAAGVVKADEKSSTFDFRVTKLEVPQVPDMPESFTKGVRKELAAWKNVSGSVVVDARGLTQDVRIKGAGKDAMAAGRANDIRVALEQTPNPLPEEEVGVGAKWQLVTVVDTGLVLRGKTTFELTKLEKNRGTVSFTIDQKSDPEPGPAVCPKAGVVVQPTSWHATGGGKRTFELAKLVAGSYSTNLQVLNDSHIWAKGRLTKQSVTIGMATAMTTR